MGALCNPGIQPDLLRRITSDPALFGGKPVIHGRRLAVEHVLSMLAAGDTPKDILDAYSFLEPDDIRACIYYLHPRASIQPG